MNDDNNSGNHLLSSYTRSHFSFINKKGALHIRETLEEAVEMAQQEHDIEFRTKLWVAESFCNKAGETNRGIMCFQTPTCTFSKGWVKLLAF